MKHQTPEEYFAAVYLRKDRRERLLHELTNPKKRDRGLDRFCHHAAPGDCLALSPDPSLDGQTLPFPETAALAFCITDASILLGNGFALVTGEAEKGGRGHFLLVEAGGTRAFFKKESCKENFPAMLISAAIFVASAR